MKRVLMNGKIETIRLPNEGISLIALPSGNLVYSTNGKVFLLNENFQEIKSVSTGGLSFCALNHRNEIYVSVSHEDCIILFDLNLNELNQFVIIPYEDEENNQFVLEYEDEENNQFDLEYEDEDEENNQLDWPLGLCCHGDYLYICDYYNSRIQILTLDLKYSSTIQLDGHGPYRVEISNTTIGVACDKATLFYDLVSKKLKYEHNTTGTYTIDYIDSIFCTLNYQQKKIYFFDSDGNFLEEKALHKKLILSNYWASESMCKYKGQLYITDWSGKLFNFIE